MTILSFNVKKSLKEKELFMHTKCTIPFPFGSMEKRSKEREKKEISSKVQRKTQANSEGLSDEFCLSMGVTDAELD